jgi:hypothetical protein
MFPTPHCSRPSQILGQRQGPRADSWCVPAHSRDVGRGLAIFNCGKAPNAGCPGGLTCVLPRFGGLVVSLEVGVGNGNRTRNRRSHSPVLCQLSYSHRLR